MLNSYTCQSLTKSNVASPSASHERSAYICWTLDLLERDTESGSESVRLGCADEIVVSLTVISTRLLPSCTVPSAGEKAGLRTAFTRVFMNWMRINFRKPRHQSDTTEKVSEIAVRVIE